MQYFLQDFFILLLAPLLMGWIKQVKAWCQNRSAPPLCQVYYTLDKLLLKQPVLAPQASWLFRCVPYVYLSCFIGLSFLLPWLDVIVIVGILALARIFLALAAMDIGTAFGSLGARRDLFIACLAEPVLLLVFLNVGLLTHTTHLGQMTLYLLAHPTLYPSLFFSLLALFLLILAETGRIPIDNPATHLELTMIHEAMLLEYSGRYLALIEWANTIKLTFYLILLIALFFPYGLTLGHQPFALFLSLLSTVLKLFVLTTVMGILESLNAKMRIFKIPEYLSAALMLAIFGLLLTQLLGTAS